jgi:hypothetical protein
MIDRRTIKSEWVVPLAIAIVVFIVFSPALHDGFVSLDDRRNFLDNDAYRGLGAAQLRWMWTTTLMGHFIPLSWMTLGLDYVLWGMNPAGYHLTNVVLHAANAVAVYFIARRLLRASNQSELLDTPYRLTLAAAAAALLFALHPRHIVADRALPTCAGIRPDLRCRLRQLGQCARATRKTRTGRGAVRSCVADSSGQRGCHA